MSTVPPPADRRHGFWLPTGLIALLVLVAAGAFWLYWPRGARNLTLGNLALSNLARAAGPANDKEKAFPAPELDGGVAWLNTEKPLKISELKGRIVLLDFWTLCCINCIHTLPDLAKLEAKYPGVLVVIGVHTPKFPNEKKTESIRKAILRYEITHPVVNDAEHRIWKNYDVGSWPTLVLIDPEGNLYKIGSGEGLYEALDRHIGELVKKYRANKMLKEDLLPFQLARQKENAQRPLYFPGKILADAAGKRLFIADSTHHRIVITDLEGKKIAVAGTGKVGKKDGAFAEASFSDPQGMALVGDTLYVADRKNHMIRALDLKAQTVKAVAGTGEQDRAGRDRVGPALTSGLNSPWDLLHHDGKLFIAMAGHHQIWTLDLQKATVAPYAGNGREKLVNGLLDRSSFAQPSGLASNGKDLFVADSEISAIRELPLNGQGEVTTVVGEGLFEFGDVDGVGSKVRLQHALGVAYRDGNLYVADTYNSKIKVINPAKQSCTTFALVVPEGEKGPVLNEPGGLSFAGDKLYVADTNSHRIRVIDLATRRISTLPLQGVEAPPVPKGRKGRHGEPIKCLTWFPNSVWEPILDLVPKLCLGTHSSKLRFAAPQSARETEFPEAAFPNSLGTRVEKRNHVGKVPKMYRLFQLRGVRGLWPASVMAVLLLGALSWAGGQLPTSLPENPPKKKKFDTSADKVKLEVSVTPKQVRRGQTFKLVIAGTPDKGWHTYPVVVQTAEKADNKTEITWTFPEGLKPVGDLVETPSQLNTKEGLFEHIEPFTWTQEMAVLGDAPPGTLEIKLKVRLMACNERQCLPPANVPLTAKVEVSAEEPAPPSELKAKLDQAVPVNPVNKGDTSPPSSSVSATGDRAGLVAFILTGVFWGFVSLITPCVFPMIPITVSYFLKQSEKEHHRPITMALVYCATIVVVLTIAALALLTFFRQLSTNPIMNFVIGGLFVFFALSLFGMYEIELPSALARFTSAREGKGGLIGTMFMALTFTIISFACVAPFLGGFGGTTANSSLTTTHRLLGGLAFAITFASPFFLLALFPSLLKKMPKSGAWLNTVKVVMGFLELAAALKFFRAGAVVVASQPTFFTYDLVLALYVALALLCGLYLLGLYRLPHDSPVEHLTVPRLLFSMAFIGLAFYLTPGLFKIGDKGESQRPSGTVFAWLDSFLLPQGQHNGLQWVGTLQQGLKKAQEERKLVFVDFTGETCTNCKLNERDVFSKPAVQELLKQYTLVALYTDIVPEKLYDSAERARGISVSQQRADAEKNLQFQGEKFKNVQLPLYVILEPLKDGEYKVVGQYDEGRINNQEGFMQFLRWPLAAARSSGTEQAAAWSNK